MPVSALRGLVETLFSWLFRAFIVFAVFIVALVVLWNLFKYFFLRRVRNVIRPEYVDLVDRMRQWFSIQGTREEPRPDHARAFTSTDKNCPICLLDPAEMPVQTNCGHVFCGNCITSYWRQGSWGSDGVKCPVCRQKVTLLMRDMRPGVVMPSDATRAAEVEEDVRRFNQRFSNEPRTLLQKLRDLPSILENFYQNFTLVDGLGVLFHGRIVMYVVMFLVYFILPFDLVPESIFGLFGYADDIAAFGLVAAQLAAMWRGVVQRE